MYEIWQMTKDDRKHKMLASTPFVDIAHAVGLSVANHLWNMDSRRRLETTVEGASYISVFDGDRLYARVSAERNTNLVWKIVEADLRLRP